MSAQQSIPNDLEIPLTIGGCKQKIVLKEYKDLDSCNLTTFHVGRYQRIKTIDNVTKVSIFGSANMNYIITRTENQHFL